MSARADEREAPTLQEFIAALAQDGKSVIVVEHNLAVMAHADWLIDMGPGAGNDGGTVVFSGTPAELVAASAGRGGLAAGGGAGTVTGEHLAEFVGG